MQVLAQVTVVVMGSALQVEYVDVKMGMQESIAPQVLGYLPIKVFL